MKSSLCKERDERIRCTKKNPKKDGKTSSFAPWLEELIVKNPKTTAWMAILATGGLVLLIYHLGIRSLPDFALSDLIGLFASVTFSGIALLFFILLGCMLPAYLLNVQEFDLEGALKPKEKKAKRDDLRILENNEENDPIVLGESGSKKTDNLGFGRATK